MVRPPTFGTYSLGGIAAWLVLAGSCASPDGAADAHAECTAPTTAQALGHQSAAIVGGQTSVRGEWPWLGRLVVAQEHLCSAVLISPAWALTAAHCVERALGRPWRVVFGDYDTRIAEPEEQWFEPSETVIHPLHDSEAGLISDHDLALVRLDRPAVLSEAVAVLALAEVAPPGAAWLTGWGTVSADGPASDVPRAVCVATSEAAACREHLEALDAVAQADEVLCVGDASGSPGACHEDSGGPVTYADEQGSWRLAGIIVAGGPDCDELTIAASTPAFADWILTVTRGEAVRSARRALSP